MHPKEKEDRAAQLTCKGPNAGAEERRRWPRDFPTHQLIRGLSRLTTALSKDRESRAVSLIRRTNEIFPDARGREGTWLDGTRGWESKIGNP